jgi:hypothetical protein
VILHRLLVLVNQDRLHTFEVHEHLAGFAHLFQKIRSHFLFSSLHVPALLSRVMSAESRPISHEGLMF